MSTLINRKTGITWRSVLGAVGLSGGLVVACLSNDLSPDEGGFGPEFPYVGPRSECSTGPAYSYDTQFPQGPRESPHPECVQRCGDHETMVWGSGAGGPSPEIDAVPSGPCQYESEACSMVAVRRCCSPEGETGQAFLFECRCKNKNWVCVSNLHGGDPCSCGTPADAAPTTNEDSGAVNISDAALDAGDQ